jgi:hypothetical protein
VVALPFECVLSCLLYGFALCLSVVCALLLIAFLPELSLKNDGGRRVWRERAKGGGGGEREKSRGT